MCVSMYNYDMSFNIYNPRDKRLVIDQEGVSLVTIRRSHIKALLQIRREITRCTDRDK